VNAVIENEKIDGREWSGRVDLNANEQKKAVGLKPAKLGRTGKKP
jgi:hypothetical protein